MSERDKLQRQVQEDRQNFEDALAATELNNTNSYPYGVERYPNDPNFFNASDMLKKKLEASQQKLKEFIKGQRDVDYGPLLKGVRKSRKCRKGRKSRKVRKGRKSRKSRK